MLPVIFSVWGQISQPLILRKMPCWSQWYLNEIRGRSPRKILQDWIVNVEKDYCSKTTVQKPLKSFMLDINTSLTFKMQYELEVIRCKQIQKYQSAFGNNHAIRDYRHLSSFFYLLVMFPWKWLSELQEILSLNIVKNSFFS